MHRGGLFDECLRHRLLARLDRLGPEAAPRWGTLRPHAAVCHLLDCLAITFAETGDGWRPGFWSSRVGRWIAIRSPLPWPRGCRAPDYLFRTVPGRWCDDVARLRSGIQRFAAPDRATAWGVSPLFGPLAAEEFARLNARHLHHHLRQFGA